MENNDLEVLILTYNRAELLRIQLESVCKQTAKGFKIKILNNASTDNTLEVIEEVKKKYPEREIEVITHSENVGNRGNFKMSQKLASAKYCAVFHDDDCIHPRYIETVLACINKHPDVVMIGSDGSALYNVNSDNWEEQNQNYLLFDADNFTLLNLYGTRHNFATMVYRSDLYKSTPIRNDLCGKIWDLPFSFEMGSQGKTILLEGRFIRYRLSAQQDSQDYTTGPFPEQIVNGLSLIKQTIMQHKFMAKTLLYYFAKSLYCYQKCNTYYNTSWVKFEKMMIEADIFGLKELFIIKKCKILLKIFKKVVKRIRKQKRSSL